MASLMKMSCLFLTPKIYGTKVLALSNQFTVKRCHSLFGSSLRKCQHHQPNTLTGRNCSLHSRLIQPVLRKEGLVFFATKSKPTGRKSKLLPFEQKRYVEKDTLLYERPTDTAWQYLGAVGAVMCGCLWIWAYNQWFYVELTRQHKAEGMVVHENSAYSFITSDIFKYVSCSWLVLFGAAIFGLSLLYPVRIVQKVILRSGGESLKIITYGHLKLSQQYLVKMENVSCTMTREKANPYVRINVQGKRSGFLLDSHVGRFPEPELFDRAIGDVKSK